MYKALGLIFSTKQKNASPVTIRDRLAVAQEETEVPVKLSWSRLTEKSIV